MRSQYAIRGAIRYYKRLPESVKVEHGRVYVADRVYAIEEEARPDQFDFRRWKEPPHLALANLRTEDVAAVMGFTRRYGVLTLHRGSFLPSDIGQFQNYLRQAWRGDGTALEQMWVDLTARFRVEPACLAIEVGDLWTLTRILFLHDWVDGRARVCAESNEPECPTPYFLAVRKGQKFCSDKCAWRANVRRFRERQDEEKANRATKSTKRGKHAKAKKV